MQGNAKSIYSVFTENSRFIVPIYQRPYSWRNEHCKQLWDDIVACATGKRDKHFFGSTVRVPDASGMIVIDGQQRITTISLLMLAIRDALVSGEKTATRGGSTKDWVLNEFLLERCYPPRMDALKLLLVHGDADAYASLMENPKTAPDCNLRKNYEFFLGCVREAKFSIDELLNGIEKLTVIDISIDPADNPQLVFESINSTGLDLTEGDKVRNFILMGLTNEQQAAYYEKYWKKIENLVRRDSEDADSVGLFIRDALTAIRSEIPGLKVIYPEFKRFYAESDAGKKGAEAVLSLLLEYAESYELLLHPDRIPNKRVAFVMACINRQECLPAYPYLVELFRIWRQEKLTAEQVAACLHIVDSFVLRRLICDLPTNSLNKIFTDLNKAISKMQEDDPDTKIPYEERLACVLKSRTGKARFPDDDEFRTGMIERHVYELRTKNRAYLLSRLEHGTSKTAPTNGVDDPVFQNIADKVYSVEHVMPQTLNDQWRKALGENADEVQKKWLHRLGNLTLTAYNSDMGNGEFASKKGRSLNELQKDNFGFSNEAHHLFLTEFISQQTQWTAAEIEKRAVMLANRAIDIWRYPATSYKPPAPPRFYYSILGHKPGFFTGSKPVAFRFKGEEYVVDNWSSIAAQVLKLLVAESEDALRKAAESSTTNRFSVTPQPTVNSEEFAPGIFACAHGSVCEKCNVLKQALSAFPGLDVEFAFTTEIESEDD